MRDAYLYHRWLPTRSTDNCRITVRHMLNYNWFYVRAAQNHRPRFLKLRAHLLVLVFAQRQTFTDMLRLAARNVAAMRSRTFQTTMVMRPLASSTSKGDGVTRNSIPESSSAPLQERTGGFFSRILAPSEGKRNPLLAALGYYSRESVALGAGANLYQQLRVRSESAARALSVARGGAQPFVLRFEMLSIHVYLSLYRLRQEKGSTLESDCSTVMQCVFDVFWTDVRNRMLIEEEGMTLIPSGRWVKECEQMFFGMALAFDDSWDDRDKFAAAAQRNVTSVRSDVNAFVDYMYREKARLDKLPVEAVLQQKQVWSPEFESLKWSRAK